MQTRNILLSFLFSLLLLLPIIIPFIINPDSVVFNTNTPTHDELTLYAPLLPRILELNLGDPQVQEYKKIPFNLMLAIQLLPFALLTTLLGYTFGYLITLLLCTTAILLLLTHILEEKHKTYAIMLAPLIYLAITLFRPSTLINLISTLDFKSYFFFLSNGHYLTRIPSISFTLPLLLLAIISLYHMLKTKKLSFALISFFFAGIYFYNFAILATFLGLLFVYFLYKKNSVTNVILCGLSLSLSFSTLFFIKQLAPTDTVLGIAKLGAINTHSFTVQMVTALILFSIAGALYLQQKHDSKWPLLWFFCTTAITIQILLPLITAFHIQPFHFLLYYALFIPLQLLTSYKVKKVLLTIAATIAILIIALNLIPQHRFNSLDPDFISLSQQIKMDSTVLALDESNRYLLPIYAQSYTYIGNAFNTYVNITDNLERYSQLHYLYNQSPMHVLDHPDPEWGDLFHHTYVYHHAKQPEVSMPDTALTLFSQPIYKIPQEHRIIYQGILNRTWTLQEYHHFDYVLIDKHQNESIRWRDQFHMVYENDRYELLEQKPPILLFDDAFYLNNRWYWWTAS